MVGPNCLILRTAHFDNLAALPMNQFRHANDRAMANAALQEWQNNLTPLTDVSQTSAKNQMFEEHCEHLVTRILLQKFFCTPANASANGDYLHASN
jgi:hypothetical protein